MLIARKSRLLALCAFLLLALSSIMPTACNTMKGAGEDIEKAGDVIHDAAEDAQD